MEENEAAGRIFMQVRNQVLVGNNCVIDINHLAVDAAIERYQVRDRARCFEKVLMVFHHLHAERQEE